MDDTGTSPPSCLPLFIFIPFLSFFLCSSGHKEDEAGMRLKGLANWPWWAGPLCWGRKSRKEEGREEQTAGSAYSDRPIWNYWGVFFLFFFTLLQISGDFWQLYIRIFEINQIRCCVNGMKSQQVQWATNYGSRMPDRNIDMSKPELGFSYTDKASRSRVLRQSASIASCLLTSLILLQQIMTQLKIYCTGSPPQTSGRTPSTTSVYSSPEYSGSPQLPSLFNWLIRADLLKDTFERVLKEFFICVQENDWDKWHGYRC